MGITEVAGAAFLEVLAFLVADDHDPIGVELGPAGANCPIVAEELVAVQFDELLEDQFEVVGGHGPIGMPGDLDRLPRLQIGRKSASSARSSSRREPADLIADLGRRRHDLASSFSSRASNS